MEYKVNYNRVILFDGSYCLHRALSVPNYWDMTNSKCIKTGGILGVIKTILKELKTYNYFPIVVFDGGLSPRRLNIFPNYKRNLEKQQLLECVQEKTEQQLIDEQFMAEYRSQREYLIELLPKLGIPTIRIKDWEGDDILYILSKMCLDSVVVSDDKDLIQLIHEPDETDNRLCNIRRALNNEFWTMESLKAMNLNVKDYIGCKAIVGDGSDNMESACYQVGEKTALGLLTLYRNIIQDQIDWPVDEETLKKVCETYNIPKRKAYLNFNEEQFIKNLLLTDLSLVDEDVNDNIINTITDTITAIDCIEDYNKAQELISQLEINSINANDVKDIMLWHKNFLSLENIDSIRNIARINEQHLISNVLF